MSQSKSQKALVVAFVLAFVSFTSRRASCQTYDFAAVDQLLSASLPALGGGASLLLAQNGDVVYRKAFGDLTLDSAVPIASASKWLSAAVIMSLVDEGKFSLDDTTGRFLPTFTGEKARITVRQLFSHTSGLPTGDAGCLGDRSTTLAACVDEISTLPLIGPPGAQFAYGGYSMQVAGRIAEIAGGKSWRQLFRERVTEPLGMSRTTFDVLGPTDNPRIAGGAISTLDDYGTFVRMISAGGTWNGRRVLSPEAVADMQADQTYGAPIVYSPYTQFASLQPALAATRYGIGEWREAVDPVTFAAREVSSQGAFGFSPWVDLRRRLAGVLLVYTRLSSAMPIYLELKNRIRQIVPERSPDAAVWILPSSARSPGIAGSFFTTDLTVASTVATGGAPTTLTLKFLGPDRDGRSGPERTYTLAAGRSLFLRDLLGSAFGVATDYGAIQIASSSSSLAVLAQTSTPGASGGTYGQSLPALGASRWTTAGTSASIPAVREDEAFRTNLILANATELELDVLTALVAEDGAVLGERRYRLPPLGMTQATRVVRTMNVGVPIANARLVLSTATPGGAFAACASIVDPVTNDPRTLLPQ